MATDLYIPIYTYIYLYIPIYTYIYLYIYIYIYLCACNGPRPCPAPMCGRRGAAVRGAGGPRRAQHMGMIINTNSYKLHFHMYWCPQTLFTAEQACHKHLSLLTNSLIRVTLLTVCLRRQSSTVDIGIATADSCCRGA